MARDTVDYTFECLNDTDYRAIMSTKAEDGMFLNILNKSISKVLKNSEEAKKAAEEIKAFKVSKDFLKLINTGMNKHFNRIIVDRINQDGKIKIVTKQVTEVWTIKSDADIKELPYHVKEFIKEIVIEKNKWYFVIIFEGQYIEVL